jgi:hypothetical protein
MSGHSRTKVTTLLLAALLGLMILPLTSVANAQDPTLQEIFDDYFGTDIVNASQDTGMRTFPAGTWTFTVIANYTNFDDSFSWYPLDDPSQLHTLITNNAGESVTVDIQEDFGLFLAVHSVIRFGGGYSQQELNWDGETTDYFKSFDAPEDGIVIAVEDGFVGGDQDYNDAVMLMVPSEPIPLTEVTLIVNAIDFERNPVDGMPVVIRSAEGDILETGSTPFTFAATSMTTYKVSAGDARGNIFVTWDGSSADRTRTVAIVSDTTLTAVYNVGVGTGERPGEPTLQQFLDGYFGPGVIDMNHVTDVEIFPAGSYEFTVVAESTSFSNIFGWYPADDPSNLQPIFDFLEVDVGATSTVNIPQDFGLYVYNRIYDEVWKSQVQLNSDGTLHFLTFDAPDDGTVVGIEDLPFGGDMDFNDNVILIVPQEDIPGEQAHLEVNAIDTAGAPVKGGLWTVIRTTDGTIVKTGFTPLTFTGMSDNSYKVSVANYDGKIFREWEDGGADRTRTVSLSDGTTTMTATYDLGDSLHDFTPLTYAGATGQAALTVNAISVDGKVLHMWTVIDPQSTDSQEITYKVYASDYQEMIFDHWEDGSTDRVRTLTISEDAEITAYYNLG